MTELEFWQQVKPLNAESQEFQALMIAELTESKRIDAIVKDMAVINEQQRRQLIALLQK